MNDLLILQTAKATLLILNIGVQVGLLWLLVSLVKKNARVAKASQATSDLNGQVLELNTQQLELFDEQVRAAQQELETQYRPRLSAFLYRDPEAQSRDLVFFVQNLGKGVAQDIKITFANEGLEDELKDLISITSTIQSLGPGYQLRCPFDRASHFTPDEDFPDDGPTTFEVELRYTDAVLGNEYRDLFPLDLSAPTGICRQ